MKNHMGLASVGYRDSTELVLKWQHSLGVSDCTIADRISKLAYIQKNPKPNKTNQHGAAETGSPICC